MGVFFAGICITVRGEKLKLRIMVYSLSQSPMGDWVKWKGGKEGRAAGKLGGGDRLLLYSSE